MRIQHTSINNVIFTGIYYVCLTSEIKVYHIHYINSFLLLTSKEKEK